MTLKGVLSFTWKWTKRIFIYGFITSHVYLILCKWIDPPLTITQLTNMVRCAFSSSTFHRDYVDMGAIAPAAKLAAIASEDQLFPDHGGFDWDALKQSLQQDEKKKKKLRGAGASTISQQVAKNVFLWQGSGWSRYVRKIPEAYFTKLIEWVWGKERILEVYLNVAEMGDGIFGIEAAAQQYFNKSASNLTRGEAAQIIACLPSPRRYTVKPQSHFVGWKSQWILRQMHNIEDDPDILALMRAGTEARKPESKKDK
jgi:monofunctional biosynthetic peptidoglycan transglycosylase